MTVSQHSTSSVPYLLPLLVTEMAEGKQEAPLEADDAAPVGATGPVPGLEAQEVQPEVRPKVLETRAMVPVPEVQEIGVSGALGEWWHSPSLANPNAGRAHTPGARPSLLEWRERRLTEDDEEEWSYSIAPGQYTVEVLRDRFGEAGYQGTPLWPSRAATRESLMAMVGGAIKTTRVGPFPSDQLKAKSGSGSGRPIPGAPPVQSRSVWPGRSG